MKENFSAAFLRYFPTQLHQTIFYIFRQDIKQFYLFHDELDKPLFEKSNKFYGFSMKVSSEKAMLKKAVGGTEKLMSDVNK